MCVKKFASCFGNSNTSECGLRRKGYPINSISSPVRSLPVLLFLIVLTMHTEQPEEEEPPPEGEDDGIKLAESKKVPYLLSEKNIFVQDKGNEF